MFLQSTLHNTIHSRQAGVAPAVGVGVDIKTLTPESESTENPIDSAALAIGQSTNEHRAHATL